MCFRFGSLVATFPTTVVASFDVDGIINGLETVQFSQASSVQTLIDILPAAQLPTPYLHLNGLVAVPVVASKRYGAGYPSVWSKDTTLNINAKTEVLVDDRFAPWNFSP